ncbi:hypothetical protein TRFO_25656 [Tritrichomonas foetus]|uniref:FHA domain-containing protein n=1 Tax=Tritrichomonas foetus TaxID=1144522 RepID=A0A1J4K4E0_9EUKA|nr:hypothetical protein TRFO_25656 [Tritrichomonas foetus]|eukprot:OHT06313.1 hypothetical protein TRFO_25656 [Tritrichomonas foetus]
MFYFFTIHKIMDFALLVLIEAKFKLPKCIILDKRVTNIGMSKTNELTFDSSSNMKYHLGKISHKRIDDKCVFVIEDTSHHGTIRVNNRKNKHSQIILKNNDFISFTSAKSYDGQENFCCKYMFFKPYELKYSLDLPKSHNKRIPENHCEKVCKGELFDSQCINDNSKVHNLEIRLFSLNKLNFFESWKQLPDSLMLNLQQRIFAE